MRKCAKHEEKSKRINGVPETLKRRPYKTWEVRILASAVHEMRSQWKMGNESLIKVVSNWGQNEKEGLTW